MAAIKFFADANIPQKTVDIPRSRGIDIVSLREINPRLKNKEVAIIAFSQNRIIITADKNFPRVVFREGIKIPRILLLVNIEFLKATEIAETIIMAIDSRAVYKRSSIQN